MQMIKNTIPILSKKGIKGKRYFNPNDTGIDIVDEINTASVVALFQNKPKRNSANIAGLTKPVNS